MSYDGVAMFRSTAAFAYRPLFTSGLLGFLLLRPADSEGIRVRAGLQLRGEEEERSLANAEMDSTRPNRKRLLLRGQT
jgi:hypothetical protein